jgi:hypothetical protein
MSAMRYNGLRACPLALVTLAVAAGWPGAAGAADHVPTRTVVAEVVALEQCYMMNRLGAATLDGMIYALRRDVVPQPGSGPQLKPGAVTLRPDKRPRPLVLRVNEGDCLEIHFTNLIGDHPASASSTLPITRHAGVTIPGLELLGTFDAEGKPLPGIQSAGSYVGKNPNSLAAPGESRIYRYYAKAEGTYLISSSADPASLPAPASQPQAQSQAGVGLFGAVHVQPRGAEFYRSQITHEDLKAATHRVVRAGDGTLRVAGSDTMTITSLMIPDEGLPLNAAAPERGVERLSARGEMKTLSRYDPVLRTTLTAKAEVTPDNLVLGETGQPLIDYDAVYKDRKYKEAPLPVLNMVMTLPVKGGKQYVVPRAALPDRTSMDLEAGIISPEFRAQFAAKGLSLTVSATVTNENGPAWLITDQGQTYLVTRGADSFTAAQASLELVYSDLTAMITGPNAGRFPTGQNGPSFKVNPASPDRRQPYREYTIIYHQASGIEQAFPQFADPNLQAVLTPGMDLFGINYGVAGIGAEVLANRLGVGPMGYHRDGVDLKYEEFFLSSWAVGDPAMVVDQPANTGVAQNPINCAPQPPKPAADRAAAAPAPPQPQPREARLDRELARSLQLGPEARVRAPAPKAGPRRAAPAERALAPPQPRATMALYPDDPSNVYHSYLRDHVKFRVLHAGPGPSHIHHLHAHQWLHTPNNDDSSYLDSQLIVAGSSYTMEIAYGGSGNRNLTVGDSIFHCHFYPHFAMGMWSLWRVHDVFEAGTELGPDGRPVAGARALPDGEIAAGTPIPAVVPLPTLGMAPLPAKVRLVNDGRQAKVQPATTQDGKVKLDDKGEVVYSRNPGYPFFIPSVAGHRAPHPPMDFAWKEAAPGRPELTKDGEKKYFDGGLPRHQVVDGTIVKDLFTRWDFTRDFILYDSEDRTDSSRRPVAGGLVAYRLPEMGTPVEKAAMRAHARRTHATVEPNGDPGNFTHNGLPGVPGAPYAPPDVDDNGNSVTNVRRYKAAVLQLDVVLSKKGWHFPQQRFLTLWEDVAATVRGSKAPEPFFFRANTGDSIEFWHTNLVPNYYELDDFQVRTPTDVIGQHIHLVKFDVTASDGAGNGFNYEDGTFSPDEVRERIDAINLSGGLYGFDTARDDKATSQNKLTVKSYQEEYKGLFGPPPAGQNWNGAQTTVQRWDTDPLLDDDGVDRTLRTVFSHDHFGPSTHQQAGLYAGLLVEPSGSTWYTADGRQMNTRDDGGPTSWAGYVVPADPAESYREFALEFQDMQLAYDGASTMKPTVPKTYLFNMPTSLAADLDTGKLTDAVRDQFQAAGIVLPLPPKTPKDPTVTVTVQTPGKNWTVTVNLIPDPKAPAETEVYPIINTTAGTNTALFVSAPSTHPGWSDPDHALAASTDRNNSRTGNGNGAPYPQLISNANPGAMSLNYRVEPAALRVANPTDPSKPGLDLASVFSSRVKRLDPELNTQPVGKVNGHERPFPPALVPITGEDPNAGGVTDTDPYTPLLRAYAGDRVQLRTLVGAHFNSHAFQISGVSWHGEPSAADSGYRNAQGMGISEHFEMLFTVPRTSSTLDPKYQFSDFWYAPSSDQLGLGYGVWGIFRAYDQPVGKPSDPVYLAPLPSNPPGSSIPPINFKENYDKARLAGAPTAELDITATTAEQCLPGKLLTYNGRTGFTVTDPNALMFVRTADLNNGVLKDGLNPEPLIVRVPAGAWIKVTLRNAFNPTGVAFTPSGRTTLSTASVSQLRAVQMIDSTTVGLHPSLLAYDVTDGDGMNVGYNPDQTIPLKADGSKPEPRVTYWYAGRLVPGPDGKVMAIPAEFGAVNLAPADPIMQRQAGLYGALIVEPAGSRWAEDATTRAMATVTPPDGVPYREAVALWQNDVQNYALGPWGAVNYRSEAGRSRYGTDDQPAVPAGGYQFFSDSLVGGDPQTPTFSAPARMPTRFRALFPGGSTNSMSNTVPVIMLEGHNWQEEPFVGRGGSTIGHDRLAQYMGGQALSPGESINLVLPSAGGVAGVAGDYLYHGYQHEYNDGSWGVLRVLGAASVITRAQLDASGRLILAGFNTPVAGGATFAPTVALSSVTLDASGKIATKSPIQTLNVDPKTGAWGLTPADGVMVKPDTILYAESPGSATSPGQDGLAPVAVPSPSPPSSTLSGPTSTPADPASGR